MAGPRLQHAAMNVPPGSQEKVRAFYGGILGLEEKQPPQSLTRLNLVWFAAGEGEMELHFRPDPNPPDGTDRRHICLVVDDLEDYRRRLTEAGAPITSSSAAILLATCLSLRRSKQIIAWHNNAIA